MKDRNILRIGLAILLGVLAACEKVIDIPLKESGPVIVIEGNIDNFHTEHRVMVSETTPFSYEGKRKPVSGASVTISEDGSPAAHLVERREGEYVLRNFQGRPGRTYQLKVNVAGEEYEARSTMPEPVLLDSVGTVEISFLNETGESVAVIYQDPPQIKNYYRFTIAVNNIEKDAFWVFNDKFTNGKSVTQTLNDFSLDLKENDTIGIEFQSVDSAVYVYWKGIQDQHPGGAVPANPVSNLSNGALGYFSAHASTRSSFVMD